jgi:hypothetical protein
MNTNDRLPFGFQVFGGACSVASLGPLTIARGPFAVTASAALIAGNCARRKAADPLLVNDLSRHGDATRT